MRYPTSIKRTVGLALLAIYLPSLWGQDTVTSLLARLASGPFDESILYSLEGQPPDPRTMPALKVAFDRSKTAEEKQWIAATLIRLGDSSEIYFGYLADLAKDAVDDLFDGILSSFPGKLTLYNVQSGATFEIATEQGDSEVLLITDTAVFYRVNDALYRAPFSVAGVGRAPG
jgi:hypothetical protein